MKRKPFILFSSGIAVGVVTLLSILNWNIMTQYIMKDSTALHSTTSSIIEQQEKRWSNVKEWADVKLAIYMTTHFPESHLNYFPCWNDAIQRMEIFKYADLILYTPIDPSPTQLAMLPFRNIIIKLYHNAGYQEGAIQALTDPFVDNITWFDEYDWVIRLNPDVLIRNDTWLIQTMINTSYDGIFHDCFNSRNYSYLGKVLHTDFSVFRPKALDRSSFVENFGLTGAETHFTASVKNIWDSKRFSFIDGANNSIPGMCRIEDVNSPVLHTHDLWKSCPYYYNATDGIIY